MPTHAVAVPIYSLSYTNMLHHYLDEAFSASGRLLHQYSVASSSDFKSMFEARPQLNLLIRAD